jgi:hypothetical protein
MKKLMLEALGGVSTLLSVLMLVELALFFLPSVVTWTAVIR